MSKLTVKYFIDGIGHYCKMKDGSLGYIAQKIAHHGSVLPRVLHNYTGAPCSWDYTDHERTEDDAPESLKKTFKRAWNINDQYDADQSGVEKIYQRMPNGMKASKNVVKKKKATKFLTASEITAGIGHFCKLDDGQEAFIATNAGDVAIVCMRSRSKGFGWCLAASDVASEFRDSTKDYKYGWGIHNEEDAKAIKVVEILDTHPEEKCEESTKKSVLDLTVRELLEKIYEAIER